MKTYVRPAGGGPAWGGIVGPSAFMAAWIVGGSMRPGYSPVDDAISQLAAAGIPNRAVMTAGFIGFGVGVPIYAAALRACVPGPAWITAAGTGLATLGVAAFPLGGSPTTDMVHTGLAVLGYATLVATPLLAAGPLRASGHSRAALASAATGVASGLCLAATGLGPANGLLQRAGLTLGHTWLAASAAWMLLGGRTLSDWSR